MKTKPAFLLLILPLISVISSCSHLSPIQEPIDKKAPSQDSCPTDIVCTENFASITVKVTYPDNTPVALDHYKVVQTSTQEDKTPTINPAELKMQQKWGHYPVTNDNFQKDWQKQRVELQFIGYQNGKEIVERKLVVSGDCCHVILLEGETEIKVAKR